MCGIHFVATSSNYTKNLDAFLRDSFITNQVRGTDGSGVFQVDNKLDHKTKQRSVRLFKKDTYGTDFIGYQATTEILSAAERMPLTVGHVRAATHGATTQNNTHPFIAVREDGSRIIGVHNGSLLGWKSNTDSEKYDVDSAWLYSKIAKDGVDAFEGFDGAFALVWYDSLHPDHFFVARNDKRPLFWCYNEDRTAMLACSELGMLGWLAERNEFKLAKESDGLRFFFPEPGFINKISLKDLTKINKEPFRPFDTVKRKYQKPVVQSASRWPHNPQPHAANSSPLLPSPLPKPATPSWQRDADDYDTKRQAEKLGRMKEALRRARDKRLSDTIDKGLVEGEEESVVIDGAQLEETLATEIQRFLASRPEMGYEDPLPSPALDRAAITKAEFTYVANPNDRNATEIEKRRAKSVGIYGLVVKFAGYFFDDQMCAVLGDFRTIENDKTITYDALVRGMSRAAGDAKYVNPTKTADMVVIGITAQDPANNGAPWLVLTDLDTKLQTTTVYNAESAPGALLH